MPHLIGPDFISIQTEDIDAARSFYADIVGLKTAPHSPPGAIVFDTKPIPFAVRTPVIDLGAIDTLGRGVAIWFGCDDADALHDHLVAQGAHIEFSPKAGPFGRYFAFRDPFGYTITAHTLAQPGSTGA